MAILLDAVRPENAQRWAAMLADLPARVWIGRAEVPAGEQPEVVITDRPSSDEDQTATDGSGRIRVGNTSLSVLRPAEVHLPADFSGRELALACRLLGEIVRLRRQQQAATQAHQRLAEEAVRDPLTGLPNRRAWDQTLAERLRTAEGDSPLFRPQSVSEGASLAGRKRGQSPLQAPRLPLCAAMLDLDHFKRVNDAHGYAAGDDVLRAVGEALRASLRQDDFVARLGGDEFGLLLWVRDAASAAATVERVRAGLPQRLLALGQQALTASAGFCVLPSDTGILPAAGVLAAIDAALRRAKQQGRDRIAEA